MIENSKMIELVEVAAQVRHDPKVPQDFIFEALERVNRGQEVVEEYPLGAPSLKGIYDIATRLYSEGRRS